MTVYLNFSRSKCSFYRKSKTPAEGFTEVETLRGKSYHAYQRTVEGNLINVTQAFNDKINSDEMVITLRNGGDYYKINLDVKDQKGNVGSNIKAFIGALYGATPGDRVSISVSETVGANDRKYLNVYINTLDKVGEDGKPLNTGYIPYDQIPRAIKDEDEIMGVSYDWKPVNKFFLLKLKEITERFAAYDVPTPIGASAASTASTTAPSSSILDPDKIPEDLPF